MVRFDREKHERLWRYMSELEVIRGMHAAIKDEAGGGDDMDEEAEGIAEDWAYYIIGIEKQQFYRREFDEPLTEDNNVCEWRSCSWTDCPFEIGVHCHELGSLVRRYYPAVCYGLIEDASLLALRIANLPPRKHPTS